MEAVFLSVNETEYESRYSYHFLAVNNGRSVGSRLGLAPSVWLRAFQPFAVCLDGVVLQSGALFGIPCHVPASGSARMVGGEEDWEAFGFGGTDADAGGASFGHEPFGLVGCLGGFGVVLGMHYREKVCRYWKYFCMGGLLLAVLGVGAYHWKKDSADGRLLMWKIAFTEVVVPWNGVGWENVPGAYGLAQERYFASGKGTPQEERVAGAPEYVFNEYLQVGIAWGFPVMFAILLMVIILFSWGHRDRQFGVCGGLFSLVIFAFASYPFQFLEFILAFLALLVSCAMGYRKVWVRVLALVLGIGIGVYLAEHRPTKNARRMFEQAHALHKAGQWHASIELLEETMKVSSDAMVLNIIGKNYQALGQPYLAESWFIRSTHRLPNRIYPYYLLAKLYAEHPKYFPREKLEWAVRMVLEKEAKVESTAIKQMREEVKDIVRR